MTKAYILLAHGSPDEQWQQPFRDLEKRLQTRSSAQLRMAYMELCDPLLEDVVAELHQGGAQDIDILPLFFAVGRHLREDVPGQVDALSIRFPTLALNLLPPVGQHPAFTDALIRIVEEGISGQKVD
ncbi:sirohydrochlorin chelatase [Larsenimonas rhizosphaerae]|uniref:CbiX/SirB N-terminal domain-containing protein n=1 Tax=Larsenimonas rhizosphaerae TaxID=2944682 RepID=A0AA42CW36_9GAMM|nr:CbiX/SirB N-terminal domain-containing protein [Larsenimonas rhizosphaerae]MCM2132178.1 CbiX/SirB N-terminal domain-containing protein [Larsenimonas rhizosphaerae]MCX2525516.1 CbiX/SirB N-terminal domain-containing protein [Larsenimonas rhizosphaerae]